MKKDYHAKYNLNRYYQKREKYIKHLGGRCNLCNSTKNLHFDHIDSSKKSFPIGKYMTYSENIVLEELKKCQLLCDICHSQKTKENKDGYNKRAKGENVTIAKLTKEKVFEIRKLIGQKTLTEISKIYGVNRKSISNIRDGITWKHV